MTTKKATTKRAPSAPKVRTIGTGDSTVSVSKQSKTAETVSVLFRSRSNQTFLLPRGRSVTIVGNGVYLANADGGALPPGGYGVTTVDKALWDEVMRIYGKTYAPWFKSGRIQVRDKETKAINYAIDNADAKTGDDPIEQEEG
jgi:hypothetical protein